MDLDMYRRDPKRAEEAFRTLLPDAAARSDCLRFFANAIEVAHQAHRSSWGTTLDPEYIRLNVGMIETFTLSQGWIYLVLDATNVNPLFESSPKVQRYYYDQFAAHGLYLSVDDSIGFQFPHEDLPSLYPHAVASHHSLIAKAAATRRNPKTREAHSPGIIDYLNATLQRNVPNPLY